jgi:hypothetical protein
MENEIKDADHALSEWEQYRAKFPELQLTHIRDKLGWLFCGAPDDPNVSLENWNFFHKKMSEGCAIEAARQLLKFLEHHRYTFWHSGWVNAALGQLVLEDESAAQVFIKPYWRQARRSPPKSTMAAYEALTLVRAEHRKHWLRAVNWMRSFHQRKHRQRESDTQFAGRALKEYRDRPDPVQHTCLQDDGLKAIAIAVVNYPRLRSTELCDQALVELYPETSRSTLGHLRAEIKKRYGRSPR